MTGRRWRSTILAAVVAVAGPLVGPSAPPAAASSGPCPGTTGVTVVVDYQALGGGVVVRCAPGSPSTGFKALTAAGFTIEEVRNVPGFLCRIDGKPGPADETCVNTPPATAYWSYWRADRGGSWVSNSEGGKTRTPPPGTVDGLVVLRRAARRSPPGIAPPAEPATPKPTAKPTAKPTPRPTVAPTHQPTPVPAPLPTPRPTTEPTPRDTPTASPSEAPEVVTQPTSPRLSPEPTGSADPSPAASDASTAPDRWRGGGRRRIGIVPGGP